MSGQTQNQTISKPLLKVLKGMPQATPPVWLMRQAGRYLPEYREIRAKHPDFMQMIYSPETASEITLQPIRRYGMDGAIVFSDILVIPDALGQPVTFEEGIGPVLKPIRSVEDIKPLSMQNFATKLAPVYETIRQSKAALQAEGFEHTAMIGFSGAPWTLACYMTEGGSSVNFQHAKFWAYHDPNGFQDLMDLLTEAVTEYLFEQIEAGAEAIQIFESWAGILDHNLFSRFVIRPTKKIVEAVRERHPHIPVIGYPRGAGRLALDYVQNTQIHALSLDQQTAPKWAASVFQNLVPVQGNLDPVCLMTGGLALEAAVEDILVHLTKGAFVFNLGHGVIKDTPPENVAELINMIRSWK